MISSSKSFVLGAALCSAGVIGACGASSSLATESAEEEGTDDTASETKKTTPKKKSKDAGVADSGLAMPVACGSELPGTPMRSGLVEGVAGYADELEAVDLSSVPDPYDYSAESAFGKMVINWMLERRSGTEVSHADALAKGGLGRAVLAAAAKGKDGEVDFGFLRRGLHYFYPCSRPVPKDLATLKARYGDYLGWEETKVDCARPKNGPRLLWANEADGVFVAETVADGGARETEVLFTNLRSDGQLDFAVYTHDGELSDRSTFAAGAGGANEVTSAAPYTCLTCHVDTEGAGFAVRQPTGTGAGCR